VTVKNMRTADRYEVDLEVELGIGDSWETARARNASLGGVFVQTVQRLAAGTKVRVRLRVPGQREALDAIATVRWQDDVGVGLQFDGLRAKDVYALGKYFESR
jgi:hypothetical protein